MDIIIFIFEFIDLSVCALVMIAGGIISVYYLYNIINFLIMKIKYLKEFLNRRK